MVAGNDLHWWCRRRPGLKLEGGERSEGRRDGLWTATYLSIAAVPATAHQSAVAAAKELPEAGLRRCVFFAARVTSRRDDDRDVI